MFENTKAFWCLLAGALFSMLIVYGGEPLNIAFGTYYKLTPLAWLIPLGSGVVLWIYAIIRTLIRRMSNPIKYSEDVYGLQMYPTRWSTGGGK